MINIYQTLNRNRLLSLSLSIYIYIYIYIYKYRCVYVYIYMYTKSSILRLSKFNEKVLCKNVNDASLSCRPVSISTRCIKCKKIISSSVNGSFLFPSLSLFIVLSYRPCNCVRKTVIEERRHEERRRQTLFDVLTAIGVVITFIIVGVFCRIFTIYGKKLKSYNMTVSFPFDVSFILKRNKKLKIRGR
jgi:hypothetical protein